MKNLLLIPIICLSLAGCQTLKNAGSRIKDYWQRPATQEAFNRVVQVGFQFATNAALQALSQYARGADFKDGETYSKIGYSAGALTLYQQASSIRQLQGTAQVLDPEATARLLEAGGTPKEISRKFADQLFQNATRLIQAGLSPDAAAEVNAAAIDQAALIVNSSEK